MMRIITATALIASLFALPAAAGEDCQTVTFSTDGFITEVTGNAETVRTALIYPFLWIQYGEYVGQDELEGTVSVNIGTAASAEVCPDGTVTLHQPTPTEVEEAPVPVTVDLVERYPDTINPAGLTRPEGWTLAVFPI